jgi:hypothetical protein
VNVPRRRRRLLPKAISQAPLAIAGFLAIPLFFSSLMASTLAQEKPHIVQWKGGRHGILTTWHEPTSGTEARIWLWALVPPLVLVLVGWAASRLRFGFYVSCTAAILIAMAVVHKTGTWERHHTARFPWGVDLIPGTVSYSASNHWDPGQWEQEARATALSLQHWTIAVAVVSMAVMGGLWLRAQRAARRPGITGVPHEGVHAPDATPPGV